ncbi:DUF454 family protein [Acetonema longum]|uniref:Inner membrane protein ybaN n=1 Tax=Acetonema longum DSM 6540 TaxID=1009370 RepID=F7NET2_9FIRM|nr:DUF454 family protein [Acetonema longum]EGO65493.1 hypothetical protein ALO_02746 [Acetonema longum DSM 6540]
MKPVYVGLGVLFLGLGAIGVVVPLLPTVPLLLLASYFFTKGSDRLHAWFLSTSIYRNHLQEFERNWALPLKSKIYILTFSTSMMLLPVFMTDNAIMHLLILLLLLIKYYIFVVKIRTIR